jgi:hypothetical protein
VTDETDLTFEQDADQLAHALRFVAAAYLYPNPELSETELASYKANAALSCGLALGRHDAFKSHLSRGK